MNPAVIKTPVTLLQEYCIKNHLGPPQYDQIGEEDDPDCPNTKRFLFEVKTGNQAAQGLGRAKKDAKHNAALNILRKLNGFQLEEISETPNLAVKDFVKEVLDICVQRNFPLAEFENIKSYGPPHAPVFECKCSILSISRTGTHSTKKGAKQQAAKAVLQIMQEMTFEPENMQVSSLDAVMETTEEENDHVIRTYRELKQSDIKKKLGVKIADRHKFFEELGEEKIAKAKEIFRDPIETIEEKSMLIPRVLGFKYEIDDSAEDTYGRKIKSFDLKNTEFDCFIMGHGDDFHLKIYNYFQVMLNHDLFPTMYKRFLEMDPAAEKLWKHFKN